MIVKDFLAKKIRNLGIKDVPVYQGGAIMHLIDSIGQLKNINYFVPYHEQSMAMSVDAYSRIKGIGVGCVTSGPGGTNLITGVCCSYYDSIPCLFITGQVGRFHIKKSNEMRQRGFQETDMVSLFSSITKFAYQIKNPHEVEYIFDKAIFLAKSGRPGPVLIDLPYDIQIAQINENKLKKFLPPKQEKLKNTNILKIKKILRLFKENKKICFIAGGGIRLSGTQESFLKLVKKTNIPFVTTWASQDITQYSNNLYFGSIGRHGHQSANEVINNSEIIITFGFRFAPKAISENFKRNKNIKIISIDIDPIELNEAIVKPDIKINIDLKHFFNSIDKTKIKKSSNYKWLRFCREQKKNKYINNLKELKGKINPYKFFNIFSKKLNAKSVIITDAGANLCWCMESLNITKNQRLISAWGNSPMGYSIAAGIGARYAVPNVKVPIYSFIGDGSFMINVQDLQFLKHHDLNLKIIVIDNQGLGNTKLGSEAVFNGRAHANNQNFGWYPPDIEKITKSFDIQYFSLKNNKQIHQKLNQFINVKGNAVLHVSVSSKMAVIDHSDKKLNSIYKF